MEIIARLREEREALVARIAQIDKMLKQYDEWGREAQRLLSLTSVVGAGSHESRVGPSGEPAGAGSAESEVPVQPNFRQVGNVEIRVRSRSSLPVAGSKTPMPEFEAAVIDVLRESGQPMDRVALYDALTTRGIVIGDGGRDKDLNALSARVYRMAQDPKNRISSERGQGYRLITDEETAEPERVDDTVNDEEDRDPLL